MDIDGNIIGSVNGEIIDSEKKLSLKFQDGKLINILPYQWLAISKNQSNIISYGD